MQLRALIFSSLAALAAAGTVPSIPHQRSSACTNPSVRKEWRELTSPEKSEYIRAAICLRNLPKTKFSQIDAVQTRLDELTHTHRALNREIHFVANFLPWHRWFVQLHEDLLRTECGFTGTQPYWDWSIDADARDVPNSPIWDAETGFGGNGIRTGSKVPGFGRCVVDGPFANTSLTVGMGWPDIKEEGDRKHCFTREFTDYMNVDENGDYLPGDMQAAAYDTRVMTTIYGFEQYIPMHRMLEGLPHAQIHEVIDGDMGPATSPNEPVFFLHHAQVDRAWAKWQGRNATRLADYGGNKDRQMIIGAKITDSMPVLELANTEPIVKDYMDIQAGPLCYTYST